MTPDPMLPERPVRTATSKASCPRNKNIGSDRIALVPPPGPVHSQGQTQDQRNTREVQAAEPRPGQEDGGGRAGTREEMCRCHRPAGHFPEHRQGSRVSRREMRVPRRFRHAISR